VVVIWAGDGSPGAGVGIMVTNSLRLPLGLKGGGLVGRKQDECTMPIYEPNPLATQTRGRLLGYCGPYRGIRVIRAFICVTLRCPVRSMQVQHSKALDCSVGDTAYCTDIYSRRIQLTPVLPLFHGREYQLKSVVYRISQYATM
jgi:hypothetical protein